MFLTLALVLFMLSLAAHEFGHAIVMRKYGVRLKEIGLGLPWGPRISFSPRWVKCFGKDCTFSIYFLLLGAFVRPEDEAADTKLGYEDQAHIFGAGIIANVIFTSLCFVVLAILLHGTAALNVRGMKIPLLDIACWSVACSAMLWFFGRKISAYIFPILSFAVLYWLVVMLSGLSMEQAAKGMGGVVTVGQLANKMSVDMTTTVYFAGMISLLLGITNLLPFYPIDGGQTVQLIADRWLPKSVAAFYKRLGMNLFVILIVLSFGGDIYHIFYPI